MATFKILYSSFSTDSERDLAYIITFILYLFIHIEIRMYKWIKVNEQFIC